MSDQPIDTGGPAFPQPLNYSPDGQAHVASEYFCNAEGMTLRDYFAGQALVGLTSADDDRTYVTPHVKTYEEWQQENAKNDATYCYRLADAMIKAREVKQ